MNEEQGRRKRLGESRRTKRPDGDPLPDLSAFMNDRFFFGDTVNYPPHRDHDDHNDEDDEEEEDEKGEEEEEAQRNKKISSNNAASRSRRTQEWLEEARLIVSSSPPRRSINTRSSPGPSILNYARHEHLSRSARNSPVSASARLDSAPNLPSSRLDSASNLPSSRFRTAPNSFTSDKENNNTVGVNPVGNKPHPNHWFANILKKGGSNLEESENVDARQSRPPRQTRHSKEAGHTLKDVLRGPKKHNSNGEKEEKRFVRPLSPPRRSMQIHMRSASSSSSLYAAVATPARSVIPSTQVQDVSCLNNFLKKQRDRVTRRPSERAKIILSAPNSSTSSMVATIGYAWLLGDSGDAEAVPVINMKRTQMRGHTEAALLFHHVGIDARSLLFADEVDMESFSRIGKLNIVMIGQDVLHTNTRDNDNDGVVSPCTLLIDEYYKQGYNLLEAPYLRKLLLAGILLDTESLDHVKHRDAQAIDLLLIDASPDHKNNLLHSLNEKHIDDTFEEVLRSNYGEPITNGKSKAIPPSSSSGKNIITQTFLKWFKFGSK